MEKLTETLLRHVNDTNYRPVKPKVIAKQLGLENQDASRLKRAIKQLVKEGKLKYGPSHFVCAIGAERSVRSQSRSGKSAKHLIGTFRRAQGGFGFVRPENTQAAVGRDADIYIPANGAGDAANGDTVRLRLSGRKGRLGKQEGRIVDIVERATNRFVGTYFIQNGMGYVQVDGRFFSDPVYVGDPGAKGAQADDKVVLEMVRFPSHLRDGEGVIVEVLGGRGEPGVDTLSIIHEFNLPGDFEDSALENARKQADNFDESIGGRRKDLTADTSITIDPSTARDFDDAISLEKTENGHWLLSVHIADVSHFVRPKSGLDRAAKDRATSVYLPDRVIPMLPEVISNNLASLQPGKIRYAMTARIELGPTGERIATSVTKSAIKSCRRFTYEEVDAYLADPSRWKRKLTAAVHSLLARMHELAMLMRKRRMERGSLELSMPELAIDLDSDGQMTGAHLEKNTESHQIIEEFMLAANEGVAEMLHDRGLAFLRRVHGAPDPRKLKALNEFVKELGLQADSLESRFALQNLLETVKDDPRQHAVNYSVLRSMQRAIYSPEEDGHYALASPCYCHFTSPIRRYPDLTIHRLIDALNRGKPPEQHLGELLALGDHCSEREGRATAAERELTKVKLLLFLQNKIGLKLDGIVTGVESFGLFVTGTKLPAEGFVHISALSDDYYKFDKAGHVIKGFRSGNTFRLGDSVKVAVASVDVERRKLDFRLLSKLASSAKGSNKARRDAKPVPKKASKKARRKPKKGK
ncbi:MAG: ribonuclease R [Pirellulales bacterium]|nr:ribonuclease R [Pirellulales bacterium]